MAVTGVQVEGFAENPPSGVSEEVIKKDTALGELTGKPLSGVVEKLPQERCCVLELIAKLPKRCQGNDPQRGVLCCWPPPCTAEVGQKSIPRPGSRTSFLF